MFDIGFWELTLIGIMGLVVLGPERLPVAIRAIRSWIAGVRKFSDTVKAEVTEELRIHELHSNLKKAEQGDLQNLSPEVAASLKSLKEAADSVAEPFKKIDTEPLDTMISSSLASASKVNTEEKNNEEKISGTAAIETESIDVDTDTSSDISLHKEQQSSDTVIPAQKSSASIESDKPLP
jgi:sec-independent protein translocase protein TatB